MTVIPLLKICKCYNVSTKIINANKAAKVGIVGIKGTLYDGYIDEIGVHHVGKIMRVMLKELLIMLRL